jgi:hypothetical protein
MTTTPPVPAPLEWLLQRIATWPGPEPHDVLVVAANRSRLVPFLQTLGVLLEERHPEITSRTDRASLTVTATLTPDGPLLRMRFVTAPQARHVLRGAQAHTGLSWEPERFRGDGGQAALLEVERCTRLSVPGFPAMHRAG